MLHTSLVPALPNKHPAGLFSAIYWRRSRSISGFKSLASSWRCYNVIRGASRSPYCLFESVGAAGCLVWGVRSNVWCGRLPLPPVSAGGVYMKLRGWLVCVWERRGLVRRSILHCSLPSVSSSLNQFPCDLLFLVMLWCFGGIFVFGLIMKILFVLFLRWGWLVHYALDVRLICCDGCNGSIVCSILPKRDIEILHITGVCSYILTSKCPWSLGIVKTYFVYVQSKICVLVNKIVMGADTQRS